MAQEALRHGDTATAARLAALLESAHHLDHARLLRGLILAQDQRYPEAISQFNQIAGEALRLKALGPCGFCQLKLGEVAEAERTFSHLLQQRPDDIDAHRGLAAAYYDLGAYPAAVEHCQAWARLDDSDGQPHRFLGVIYQDLKQYDRAIPSYRAALSRSLTDPIRQEIRVDLAESLLKHGEHSEALQTLEGCSPGPPALARALFLRAEALRALGRGQEALAVLEQARAANPDLPDALRLRASFYLEADDPQAAAVLLERAVQLAPNDYAGHHLLAQAYARLRRPKEAERQQAQVKEIQGCMDGLTKLTQQVMERPREVGLHLHMAELYDKIHLPEMAARSRRNAAAVGRSSQGLP